MRLILVLSVLSLFAVAASAETYTTTSRINGLGQREYTTKSSSGTYTMTTGRNGLGQRETTSKWTPAERPMNFRDRAMRH